MQLLAPVQTHFEIEAHPIAATVHLRGSLTAARAMAAMNACHALPGDVRALVVDLQGVERVEADGLYALHSMLRRWRQERDGSIRVLPPLRRAA